MQKKALVIIDIQNDTTKHYKEVITNINRAIDWAVDHQIHVVYLRHENLSPGARTFLPNTAGSKFAPDLNIVSDHVFTKFKENALTSEGFSAFILEHEIDDFYLAGADAVACVKSTSYNLRKAGYGVHVFADCVASYNPQKVDEMLRYYESKGCEILRINDLLSKKSAEA